MQRNAIIRSARVLLALLAVTVCALCAPQAAFAQLPNITSYLPTFGVVEAAGGPDLTITLVGSNFNSSQYVPWQQGSESYQLFLTAISSSLATITIPNALLQTPTRFFFQVFDPRTGQISNQQAEFDTYPQQPGLTITAVAPSPIVGATAQTITVTGNGFVSNSIAAWNGTNLTTTYLSPTQLTAALPGTDAFTTAPGYVTVFNPSSGHSYSSNGLAVPVVSPVPVITSVSPNPDYSGAPNGVEVLISGTGFLSGANSTQSVINWNGTPLPTFPSGGQIYANGPASLIANPGTATITVMNPGPGGGTSAPATVTILQGDYPTLAGLSPASIPAGSPATSVTLTGTGFSSASTVTVGYGTPAVVPTYVSPTQMTVVVPTVALVTGGPIGINVTNPGPGGGSSSLTLNVTNPVPTVTAVTPDAAVAGSGPFTITVTGTNFVPPTPPPYYPWSNGSYIVFNGMNIGGQFLSSTQMTATVSASLIATQAAATVAVDNPSPGGGSSNSVPFSIAAPTALQTTYGIYGIPGPGGWYNGAVNVTLYAVSPNSVAHTYYILDGGPQTAYSAVFNVSGTEIHTLQYWSVDALGTIEPTNTASIKIDTGYPTVMDGTPTPAPNAAGWNNTPVSVPFTASESPSGIYSTTPSASPLVLSAEGTYQGIYTSAKDNAGISSGANLPYAINIDTTPPVTSAALSGTQGTGGVYTSAVSITFAATDNLSGVAATDYTLDGGGQQTYGGSINLANGAHTLTYWSVDVAGNVETAHVLMVVVDRNPTANNDTLTMNENTMATVPAPGVLANDADPNNLPLTATLVTNPAHGTVALSANGAYVYTPTPQYAGTDSFTYQVSNGTYSSNVATVSITVQAVKPSITGFTPASGPIGAAVTINGSNLTGATLLGFTGAHAKLLTINAAGTQIMTTVPAGAQTGPLALLTPSGVIRSAASFTVVAPPAITGFSPASGPVGTVVTITGTSLTGTSVVGFQGKHATVFSVNAAGTQVTATVPTGAQTGQIALLTPSGIIRTTTSFTVTP